MSDFLSITDNGTIQALSDKLLGISQDRLMAWIKWALGAESDEFVDFVKKNYLSGQSLGVISGETRSHVGAWMQKKVMGKHQTTFVIRPGKGIDGRQNYLERWTGTKHEFMRPAFAAFGAENQIARAVEANISSQLRKVESEK